MKEEVTILLEIDDVMFFRHLYLRKIDHSRKQKYGFLDEAWVNVDQSVTKAWVDV